jgi:hypothetical protein
MGTMCRFDGGRRAESLHFFLVGADVAETVASYIVRVLCSDSVSVLCSLFLSVEYQYTWRRGSDGIWNRAKRFRIQ